MCWGTVHNGHIVLLVLLKISSYNVHQDHKNPHPEARVTPLGFTWLLKERLEKKGKVSTDWIFLTKSQLYYPQLFLVRADSEL